MGSTASIFSLEDLWGCHQTVSNSTGSAQRPTHLSGFYKKERGAGYKAQHEHEEQVTHDSGEAGYMCFLMVHL